MQSTSTGPIVAGPNISIRINEERGSTYYDRELATALIEIWIARKNWTPEQREIPIAISTESYTDHAK